MLKTLSYQHRDREWIWVNSENGQEWFSDTYYRWHRGWRIVSSSNELDWRWCVDTKGHVLLPDDDLKAEYGEFRERE